MATSVHKKRVSPKTNFPYKRTLRWLAGLALVILATVAAVLVYEVRQPPVVNSRYVALGSSFAAGAGLGPRAPGSPLVSYRSINGYPQQLARMLQISSFTDMTSSGSTIRHVLHGGQWMLGPQLDALGPDTRLVTLTSGGNDVSYVGDLAAMAYMNDAGLIGSAFRVFWKEPQPVARRDFSGLAANMKTTFEEIRKRSPMAQIVVVTYPVIVPETGTCRALGISEVQATLIREVGHALVETTLNAATAGGAIVVNMDALASGHDACSSDPWVSGFDPKEGQSFHPTLAGARATAQAIAAVIQGSD